MPLGIGVYLELDSCHSACFIGRKNQPMRPASNSFNTLLFSVILLTGIAISITGSKLLFDYSHEQGQLWIERHVESRAEELQLRIEATLRLLSATAALFHANPSASRDEFRRFVVANLDQHTDTIAIAWVPRISDDQRQQFESDLVSLGGRWKKIIDPNSHGLRAPALRQAEYFPIKFLVSTVDNELSPGINLGALYKTRKRLQLASQSAELLTTQAIRLTRGKPGLITFQAFLPVYRDGSANATGAGRSDELTGFIMGQFDIRALVEESFGREELLSLVLFDVDARPADQLLFQSNMAGDAALTLHEMSDLAKIEQPYWTRYFDVGNRKWLAAFVGTTGLPQQNLNWLPYIGLFAGLLITSLLALYLFIAQSRTRQVQDLKTESQAKTHFIQAISHDLRQPLHSISLNLSRFDQSLDEPSRMQLVEKLKQAVTGLNNMFDSLLDITRLEAGVITPVVREFAIDNVLTELGDEFDLVASQKGIELNQRSQPLMVKTDPVLLERVLRNLLNNAVKYTGSGKILLACRKQGDVARVVIMDTGPGIDPGQITVITEPYQRGAEVSAAEGLGLGLAIVKQTTDLLHLPFRIHSTPGRGSCFTLDIPLAVAIAREHKHT
ncbi:MAG TPA: CHASE domain-containing protein, partial [Gammaproteobacteria bacterium]|nr:CHASE domain-containing protein [Gammaproteobacteria bacterium]